MSGKVTIILIVAAALCQGECPTECYCDVTTICSGDKHLKSFPYLEALDLLGVNRLELHEFLVEKVEKSVFQTLVANLTEIRITNNPHLLSFENDTFSDSSSSSEVGADTFTIVTPKRWGNVSGDRDNPSDDPFSPQLSVMDSSIFNLRSLDCSRNSLQYFIAGEKLRRLRLLDVSSNRLQQVYGLETLYDLESVNLRDNLISFLPGTLFQNMRNLQYINLDSNKIARLDPTIFSNLPSLAYLILSSNPTENLLPSFFWNSRVQFVDVSGCGLTRIPTSLTNSVRDFRCAHNNLTNIRNSDFESYLNVGLLVLDENSIETIEDDAFGRLDFLARLWINRNRLTKVPQNLPPSLRSLQLEDNRISSLSTTDFLNLSNLEELNLHGNQISSIPDFIFNGLVSLRSLDLRSNQVDTIHQKTFANLVKLEALEISQNPLKVIINGAFSDLRNLSLLLMSRLQEKSIEYDSTSFRPIANLKILELDDSPTLVASLVRDYLFTNFLSLTELNLQRSNLENLQLVATSILEAPFFSTLQTIKLGGNPWKCPQSSSSDTYKSFLQLQKRQVILDVDQMICDNPKGIKVMSVAIKASSSSSTTNRTTTSPSPLTKTKTLTSNSAITQSNSGPDHPVPSAHQILSQASLLEKSTPTSLRSTTKSLLSPQKIRQNLAPGGKVSTISNPSALGTTTKTTPATKEALPPFTTPLPVIVIATKLPTLSYFKDETASRTFSRLKEKKKGSPTLPVAHYGLKVEVAEFFTGLQGGKNNQTETQLFSESSETTTSSNSKHGNKLPLQLAPTTRKTIDDKAIIDEETKQQPLPRYHFTHQRENFLSSKKAQSFNVQLSSSLPQDSAFLEIKKPNPAYLKSSTRAGNTYLQESQAEEAIQPNNAVILKTLIISAVVCLLSILVLLLISLIFVRYSSLWRSKLRPVPVVPLGRRQWEKQVEDSSMIYSSPSENPTNFHTQPKIHRGPTGMSYTRLGDQDTVELSGITNRLYFENEDIYHIT